MNFLEAVAERIAVFQGHGDAFTFLGDALIRAHAFALGFPGAQIETTERVNDADGGVDTRIRTPMPGDTSGWFSEPTVWQYKGQSKQNVLKKLSSICERDFIKQCIREGAALRLAVADSLTSEERFHWEENLLKQVQSIKPDALLPRVVTATDLAALASHYPAFVLSRFFPEQTALGLHLGAWKESITAVTAAFISVPTWEPLWDRIQKHVDFAIKPTSALQVVQGKAGVGKTRMTYEVLASTPGASSLVLYCSDGAKAVEVVQQLLNQKELRAIVVADESDPEDRLRLSELVRGSWQRLRVIAIDNSEVQTLGREPELTVDNMPESTLQEVLAANFPEVPAERRATYAKLAEGFPRLAADLCRHNGMMTQDGRLGLIRVDVGQYLSARLSSDAFRALQALSLVTKLGYRAEVEGELTQLCEALKLSRQEVEHHLHEIHDGPGFVSRGGRYFYVTPEVVAAVAFDAMWNRWARAEPAAFLKTIPQELQESFLNRVKRSGRKEVQDACSAYFQSWVSELRISDLVEMTTTRRLVALTESSPERYLPMLRRLLEECALDEVRNITGDSVGGEWGPRRALVWLMEGLAQFSEFFDEIERVLLRLALAENEERIGNNATAIWCQVFRILLSGTPKAFAERFVRLQERARDPNPAVRMLTVRAMDGALSRMGSRMGGPATVGGRLPPREWAPRDDEYLAACRLIIGLLREQMEANSPGREAAVKVLITHTRHLLDFHLFDEIRAAFAGLMLTDEKRAELLEVVDDYLIYDTNREPEMSADDGDSDADELEPPPSEYVEKVRAWRAELGGTSLHERLVSFVGRPGFSSARHHNEEAWLSQIETAASELVTTPTALVDELPWLLSGTVPSAGELGEYVGRKDAKASHLETILSAAAPSPHRAFARGYVIGLLSEHPEHAPTLNELLDTLELFYPDAVAEFALSAVSMANALERVLRLYDAGKLPVAFLHVRNFFVREGIVPEGMLQLLQRLVVAAQNGDATALWVGLDSLHFRMPYDTKGEVLPIFEASPAIVDSAWRLLQLSATVKVGRIEHWDTIAIHLGLIDPLRAARFACSMLFNHEIATSRECERVLVSIAKHHPSEVMQALGEVMLDKKRGMYFYIGKYRDLFRAIPDDVIKLWLEQHGVEGARKIARHLPKPSVAGERPVVPPLTEWVLTRFENDDKTFHEFCMGVHSFQLYGGDIAAQLETEARWAQRFLEHPVRRIREWAVKEEQDALAKAQQWRERDEEDLLPE